MLEVREKLGMSAIEEAAENKKGKAKRLVKQLHENPLLVVSDNLCQCVSMIIEGIKGEQHVVNTFNPGKKTPTVSQNKAANLLLEYNMNSHIRNYEQIFICETAPNNDVIAK